MFDFKMFLKLVFVAFVYSAQFLIESSEQYSFYHSSPMENNNTGCVVTNHQTGEHWRLMYEDNFKENSSLDDWYIRHETTHCNSYHNRFRSCKSRDNVRIIDGHLVLQTSRIPQNSHQFTAAELRHKDKFSFGRYEIRVAHPVGAAIQSEIQVVSEVSGGYVGVSHDFQDTVLQRGFQLQNETFVPMNLFMAYNSTGDGYSGDLHNFNVYGLEWNHTIARLFVNEQYTAPLDLGNIQYELGDWHSLVLATYVSGQESQGKTDLLWTCPAMIFDYIRIFQRIDSVDATHSKCSFRSLTPNSVIDGICSQVMDSMSNKSESIATAPVTCTSTNQMILIWLNIITIGLLIVVLVAFLLKEQRTTAGTPNSWIQWRWTNGRNHQENQQLNEGFERSSENVRNSTLTD